MTFPHAHCPKCDSLLVRCNVCETDFIVVNGGVGKDFAIAAQLSEQELAQNAAVWHVYEEHRGYWNTYVGDRPPTAEKYGRVLQSVS